MKKLARSKVTKILLFAIFLAGVWFTLFYSMALGDVGIHEDMPFESTESPNPEDSWQFRNFERDLVSTLFYKDDVSQISSLDRMPAVYYRAEYPDGSVITNVDAATYRQQGDDFFRSHKVFTILSTTPNGGWNISGDKDNSQRRHFSYPPEISRYDYVTSTTAYTNAFGITTITEEKVANLTTESIDGDENDLGWSAKNPCPIVRIAYAFDDASLAAMTDYYTQCRNYLYTQFAIIGAFVLTALVAAIWLMVTCGRRRGSDELHTIAIDRIPAELQLTIFCGLCLLFGCAGTWEVYQLNYVRLSGDPVFFISVTGLATALAGLALLWAMSMIRMLKAKIFFRHSITFRLCRWCWRPFAKLWDIARSCFDERSFRGNPLTQALVKRQIAFIASLEIVLLLLLLIGFAAGAEPGYLVCWLLLVAGLAAVAYWHVSGNRKTYEQINQGMSDSVAEQMKSERTKTALITNVSHDLKTPLTSIITYVDLLSQEELSDTARDYVTILEQKSERLKAMVSDLFDLAKSSSGNLPLELETLDLHRLLEQTLADMRDSIDASGLTIKTTFPEGEVSVYSDGKKLYRVFQNIIGNALKYSLAGTRVYVSLELVDNRAVATVRNTAGYEMDFTAEEVLQRFVRGDKSRSGEGSGLGLSIADSFTTACGGEFLLSIDGDLFKVTTSFPVQAASRAIVTSNA